MTIEWTETARQDLREIRRFIARDSKKYAARMIARIREAVELMSAHPEAGHWLPEVESRSIREIYVASFRIVYRTRGETVQVLTVIHGAQNFDGRLE